MAWLASCPSEWKGTSRREMIARFHGDERAAEYDVDPGPLAWLLDLWADAGQCRVEQGPMGAHLRGFDWRDIVAWLDGAQEHDLAPLFRRGIMALSSAYAREAMEAQRVECPAPYDPGRG